LIEETTSPTSTALKPINVTPPTVVDESHDEAAVGEGWRRFLRDLVVVVVVLVVVVVDFGVWKEREEEDNTNPMDLRLFVSTGTSNLDQEEDYPCK
jgi:hypothetical protein